MINGQSKRDAAPSSLPRGMLATIARHRGILLCLDYDGTVSEITPDAANARPVADIASSIERIANASTQAVVAIVTGRRIEEVRRLLGIDSRLLMERSISTLAPRPRKVWSPTGFPQARTSS
jgi:alpha,alpha-trehalase